MENAVVIDKSDFMSFVGYRTTSATTAVEAFDITNGGPATTCGINVAIMLHRVEDPTAMLAGDWASRQKALQDPDLWSKYGADHTHYDKVVQDLTDAGFTLIPNGTSSANSYYTSSYENRTIWVQLDSPAQFNTLFGSGPTDQVLQQAGTDGMCYWDVDLTLPSDWRVAGLWFDQLYIPAASDLTTDLAAPLQNGPQSQGNSGNHEDLLPSDVAVLYNFPLAGLNVQTGTIGLMEPGVGSWLSTADAYGSQFQSDLDSYLQRFGIAGTGQVSVQGLLGQNASPNTQQLADLNDSSGERTLDVAIAASVNPNSNIQLFNGSGAVYPNAGATVFTAVQAAIWGGVNGVLPEVTSSSFADPAIPHPDSPYHKAYWELYIDAALKNQTTVSAAGDGGSSGLVDNGLTNVRDTTKAQAYNIVVGGTSLSGQPVAMTDQTLDTYTAGALAGDLSTLWQLIRGGLTILPASGGDLDRFVETVWNQYTVSNADMTISGYASNSSGGGGVDVTQPTPWYQTAYGLSPVTSDSEQASGRGVPDVSLNGGGNMHYLVPNGNFSSIGGAWGTSAAAPMWASLIIQFNYIFQNQGLPNLGFMNDLLYVASVIAPGSFNDVTIGNNNSSFYYNSADGTYTVDGYLVTPTDKGYSAGNGYDYVTGLGTPNGVLLARALTGIAHSQYYFDTTPDLIDAGGSGDWTSGAAQTLLLQTTAAASATVTVDTGTTATDASSGASGTYAWTSLLAQQSLQSDFDGDLLALFDGQSQGTLTQAIVANGDSVSVTFNGAAAVAAQANLSASFGFADFFSDATNSVRLAQAVAVAETAGGADDVNVVVRMRQVAGADLSLMLYKVDDYNGTIGGLAPDQAGYATAAAGRAYAVMGGGTTIAGPGDGNAGQAQITGVDAGDLIAMQLTNVTSGDTFWAFSQANEMVGGEHIAHLWNYGANTWGWEDLAGGGDRDFNDLIVQLDFTSTAGSGLLVA
ncbi:hypothetical protein LJ725_25585 [Reyranella aquatilis]|uniref:Peptidase S53 domain-containing protein n=1 Tax=Reyranella aquatilis TaxID=2035356 RepID=A0ABS8L209_9HYPH|nr:DUF4114 domain-containing protein [Reyranella aquatilis]MCC8432362.1 hypothetical protein [Reyranella aquatilis]